MKMTEIHSDLALAIEYFRVLLAELPLQWHQAMVKRVTFGFLEQLLLKTLSGVQVPQT